MHGVIEIFHLKMFVVQHEVVDLCTIRRKSSSSPDSLCSIICGRLVVEIMLTFIPG